MMVNLCRNDDGGGGGVMVKVVSDGEDKGEVVNRVLMVKMMLKQFEDSSDDKSVKE